MTEQSNLARFMANKVMKHLERQDIKMYAEDGHLPYRMYLDGLIKECLPFINGSDNLRFPHNMVSLVIAEMENNNFPSVVDVPHCLLKDPESETRFIVVEFPDTGQFKIPKIYQVGGKTLQVYEDIKHGVILNTHSKEDDGTSSLVYRDIVDGEIANDPKAVRGYIDELVEHFFNEHPIARWWLNFDL